MPEDESRRPGEAFLELVAVMQRLRDECAWTQQQTHETLSRYLLEEAHETLEALDSGDRQHLGEELGDLLMQVVFHSVIAAETPAAQGGWDVDDVARGITDKLVRRNPHVFADGTASTPEEIDAAWQAVKATEKRRTSPLDGIAPSLPALSLAAKVLGREPELQTDGDDVGSRLLRLVAEAQAEGIDAEEALRQAVRGRLS